MRIVLGRDQHCGELQMRTMTASLTVLPVVGLLVAPVLAGEGDTAAKQDGKDRLAQAVTHWTRKADMPSGAPFPFEHPAVLEGRLFVVRSDAVFSYDPGRDSWSHSSATLPLRRHHFAVAAAAGRLFAFCG